MTTRAPIYTKIWRQDDLAGIEGLRFWTARIPPPQISAPFPVIEWDTFPRPDAAVTTYTWTASYNLNLIGKDVLPTGKQITDLPPRAYPEPATRTWTFSYNPNLIGQDVLPSGKQSTERPPLGIAQAPQVDLRTWTLSLNTTTLGPVQAPVGVQVYDLAPRAFAPNADNRTWINYFNLNLVGQDQLPTGKQTTELAPRAPQPNADNRTWVWNYNLNLIGQDVLPTGAQFSERPPLGPFQPLRVWNWSYLLGLIGRDQLPTGQQVFELAPRAYPPQHQQRTWTWSYFLTLIGQDILPTGAQSTALTVPAPYFDVSLRTWLQPPLLPIPFAQFDWPVPVAPPFTIDKRTWTWQYNLNLIGQDALIVGKEISDRPPLAPIPPENLKSWIQQTNLALLTAPIPKVVQTTELPRAPLQPALGQTSSYLLTLIGQDQLPAGKQSTDLVPRGISATDLRSWVQATAQALTAINIPAGVQVYDLPPRAAPQAALGQASSYNLNLIGQDQLPVGRQVTDLVPRPAPTTDYRSWIWFTSLALNNSLGVPIGKQLSDLPPFAAQRPADLSTWLDRTKLALLVPFAQFDWPNPQQPQSPQRSFTGSAILPLTTAVKPFLQTDWPLPIPPQNPQRSFTASFPLYLIGQDKLPPGANRYDLTPVGYPYPPFLRTSTVSPAVPPVVVAAAGGDTLPMMGV